MNWKTNGPWKYMTIGLYNNLSTEEVERELNAHGRVGWELVSVVPDAHGNMVAFFKKPT